MFYSGCKKLHSLIKVKLIRDKSNPHDENAIMVFCYWQQLGHIERHLYLTPVRVMSRDKVPIPARRVP